MISILTFSNVARGKFLNPVRGMRSPETPEFRDDPERILSRRPADGARSARQNNKRSSRGQFILEVVLLTIIVMGGIAAVVGLRELGAGFGVVWFGDH